jgi:hypothetical protein
VTAPAVPTSAPVAERYVIPARRQQRASGFAARPSLAVASRRQQVVDEHIARPSLPPRDEFGMDVDSDEQDIPLPPPSPSQDDNMDLYSDPHFDADGLGPPMERNTAAPWPSTELRHNQEQESEEEEDLALQSPLYSNSEFDRQPYDSPEEDDPTPALPSSPASTSLFVHDENETRNFEAALAWEEDVAMQTAPEQDQDQASEAEQQPDSLGEYERTCDVPSSAPALDAC